MVELTRVLHPVGQGGFYTETFNDENNNDLFKMVYDCGSETGSPHDIISYLKKYFPKKKIDIDAVFISHLHNDHINGLEYLLSATNIKYLFLPKLTPNVVIEAYLNNYIKTGAYNNPSNNCITNLINRTIGDTEIIEINEIDGDNGDFIPDDNSNVINIDEELRGNVTYGSGTRFAIKTSMVLPNGEHIKWLYILFNSPRKTKKGENLLKEPFFDDAKDANGNIMLDKLPDLIKKEKVETCKQIYEKCFGKKHNEYSMTLFSGIENPDAIYIYRMCNHYCQRCYDPCSPNFLYTGDFEPNKKCGAGSYVDVMKKHLGSLWETISGIQVPHHGSRKNFNSELYKYPCRAYVSAGSVNKYNHPNVDTLVNIQKECCRPIIVSEDLSSMQVEDYELRSRWK